MTASQTTSTSLTSKTHRAIRPPSHSWPLPARRSTTQLEMLLAIQKFCWPSHCTSFLLPVLEGYVSTCRQFCSSFGLNQCVWISRIVTLETILINIVLSFFPLCAGSFNAEHESECRSSPVPAGVLAGGYCAAGLKPKRGCSHKAKSQYTAGIATMAPSHMTVLLQLNSRPES